MTSRSVISSSLSIAHGASAPQREVSLSLERIEECETEFRRFCGKRKEGTMLARDLLPALQAVGQHPKDKWILGRSQRTDINITLDEFIRIVTRLVNDRRRDVLLQESFKTTKDQKQKTQQGLVEFKSIGKRAKQKNPAKIQATSRPCCVVS